MVRLDTSAALADYTLDVTEEIRVHASLADTFAALLLELGPENRGMGEQPMPMVLEAQPGGRWFRDLGDNNGHCDGYAAASETVYLPAQAIPKEALRSYRDGCVFCSHPCIKT